MLNVLINLMKWPIAVGFALFAWFAAGQLPAQFAALSLRKEVWIPVVAGLASYLLLWRCWLRNNRTVAWASVMEHELTHALASLATLNGVHRLQADSCGAGHISVPKGGNWIIFVAPYVFPTVLLVPALLITGSLASSAGYGFFGVALGFHIQSTFAETHWRQTDLKNVGWLASAFVLPASHIIVVLATLGLLIGHQHGMTEAWAQTRSTGTLVLYAANNWHRL